MVAMIFADECSGQERQHHFGTRQANEAHELFQRCAMFPVRKRLQHVLARGVFAAEKPNVGDAERSRRPPRFDLADVAQSCGLFRTGFIRTAASVSTKDYSNALALIDRARQIGSRRTFVVGMGHDQQNVGFVSGVGQGQRLDILRKADSRQQ
jgi:hypothetical protein